MSEGKLTSIEQLVVPYKEEIKNSLPNREIKCPMCGNTHFKVYDALGVLGLQTDLNIINVAGPALRTIILVCSNCGFISQHDVETLFNNNKQRREQNRNNG